MKERIKNIKGITLISLVVTIIILLILAGLAINIALGDNGLFIKSKEAVEIHKESAAREKVSMAIGEFILDINSEDMTEEEKDNHLKEILSNLGPTSIASDANYYKAEVDGYIFWINRETLAIESKGIAKDVKPETITVTTSTIELIVGHTDIIEMTITPADASRKYIKYTSSDENIVTVKNGTITGTGKGTATITIESAEDSTITVTITVNVKEVEAESISVEPTTLALKVGEVSEGLKVTFTPWDAADKTITWSTNSASIATVSTDGKVTGVAVGTTKVMATTPNGKTAECEVNVIDPDAKRAGDITILPKNDYGKVVTGYNSKTSGITWRLWYVDNVETSDKTQDTIYLIGDFIKTSQVPQKSGNSAIGGQNDKCSYFGLNATTGIMPAYTNSSKWVWDNQQTIASKWLKKWYDYGSHKTSGDNNNMKAVAYMMDSSIWKEKFGDTSNKANYVLGGPTLEMFCASYKDSHPRKYLESQVTGDTGYDIAWNENGTVRSYSYTQDGVDATGNNKIYAPGSSSIPFGMWLASPSSYSPYGTDYVMRAGYNGSVYINLYSYTYCGFCPVVCLKPGVQILPSGDGFAIQ